jgi:uncharacterized membrane protein
MSNIEDFLTSAEEQEIIEAIRTAEKSTTGEIRVHIEQKCEIDIYEHALEVFHILKMDNTRQQNGVLIYVAVDNKSFVICGDQGINNVVGKQFWNSTRDIITSQFKKGNFKQGLVDGVIEAGKALSKYFPYQYNNPNELDNKISKG